MKRWMAAVALAGSLWVARSGYAQEDEAEKIKKQILSEVEKRLKAEEERILNEISKIVDEELAKWKKGEKPSSHEPKKEEPKKKAPGFLGINVGGPDEEEHVEGVRIADVMPDGPAKAAGLRKGDVIVKVDETAVPDRETLLSCLKEKGEGTPVKIEFQREGKTQSVIVTLAPRPEPKVEEPKDEPKEEPKKKDDLRERVKKFLDRKDEAPKKEEKHGKKEEKSEEGDDFLALTDEMMEQVRPMLEQFGMNPDDYFEKGEDGKWRPGAQLQELFKQFDFKRFFGKPEEEDPEEETPKKVEKPKKEEKKVESAKPGWIGIVPAELSDEERAELDIEGGVGLAITEVMEGSPAAKSGVQKGDILVRINDKKVKGEESLQKFVASAKAGQECELTLVRKGKEVKVKLTLAERKD